MTHKAELVVVGIVGCVEEAGEILPEYPEVIGAMRVMACGAVVLPDRAVVVRVCGQDGFYIGNLAVGIAIFPVMALHAQRHRLGSELHGVIGCMRIVAGEAYLSHFHYFMLYSCAGDLFLHILVAGEAQRLTPIFCKAIFKIAAMWIMALHAPLFCGVMDIWLLLKFRLLLRMARKTDLIAF